MSANIQELLKKNADPKSRGKHFIGTYNNWDTKLDQD